MGSVPTKDRSPQGDTKQLTTAKVQQQQVSRSDQSRVGVRPVVDKWTKQNTSDVREQRFEQKMKVAEDIVHGGEKKATVTSAISFLGVCIVLLLGIYAKSS